MIGDLKKMTCAAMSVAALTFGLVVSPPAAVPAVAQPQTGLVNIAIDDTNVVVPIQAAVNIAANVCGNQVSIPILGLTVGGPSAVCVSKADSGKQLQFTRVQ